MGKRLPEWVESSGDYFGDNMGWKLDAEMLDAEMLECLMQVCLLILVPSIATVVLWQNPL